MAVTKEKAQAELESMKRTLGRWLELRQRVDGVLAGTVAARVTPSEARSMVRRDEEGEQALATQLHALLSQVYGTTSLPNADVRANPNAAAELARIAIHGMPVAGPGAQAMGALPLVPLAIGAGALVLIFTITSAIRNRAEVQMHKEEIECIKLGACVDWKKYMVLGALGMGGYVIWKKYGSKR